jgi:hypothetical protein
MSFPEAIYATIIGLLGVIAVIPWTNLAWRHPIKFRSKLFNDGGKQFGLLLWIYRILFLLFGLVALFILLIGSFFLANFIK